MQVFVAHVRARPFHPGDRNDWHPQAGFCVQPRAWGYATVEGVLGCCSCCKQMSRVSRVVHQQHWRSLERNTCRAHAYEVPLQRNSELMHVDTGYLDVEAADIATTLAAANGARSLCLSKLYVHFDFESSSKSLHVLESVYSELARLAPRYNLVPLLHRDAGRGELTAQTEPCSPSNVYKSVEGFHGKTCCFLS
jgi:hypothetical protein